MSDASEEKNRIAQVCERHGHPRKGNERVCKRCGTSKWVTAGPAQPQAMQPVPEQPEPQAPEPAPADQEPAAAGQVPPEPVAVPDPVAASRASCLIASFTVKGSSFSYTLAAGETIALGRDPDWSPLSDHFAADDSVSRKHAELALCADGRARLTDRKSTNHTVVNGKKLPQNAPWEVRGSDRIALGECTTLKIKIIGGSGHGPAPAGGES